MTAGEEHLHIQSLHLERFRSYPNLALEYLGNLSLFVGNNAVGKTSILEAIYLVTALKSFRTSKMEQLVLFGETAASVEAQFTSSARTLEEKLVIEEGKRSYFINGKKKRLQDLKGMFPAVSFTPDDLGIVKGSHTVRRNTLDDLGTQLSKNFYVVKRDYEKIVRQKNQALKEECEPSYLESINDVLAKVGAQYLSHRHIVIEKFLPFLSYHFEEITAGKEQVYLAYQYSWGSPLDTSLTKEDLQNIISERLETLLAEEMERKRCLVGPHLDHLLFEIDGKDAIQFASQGQQRCIVLAWKLAEASLLQDMLGQKPIMLLDDVMSELDEQRRACLMHYIKDELQTFVTTTNIDYFSDEVLSQGTLYQLPFAEGRL